MSTPPNRRISRLEALPDELLQDILYYCLLPYPEIPFTIQQEQRLDYGKGVQTSRKFSAWVLASKRIYQLGQPLLWRHLEPSSPSKVDMILDLIRQRPELGIPVRTFDGRKSSLMFSPERVKDIVEMMPLLEAMMIMIYSTNKYVHDFSSLQRLTCLIYAWNFDPELDTTFAEHIDPKIILPPNIKTYAHQFLYMVSGQALKAHFSQLPRLQELHFALSSINNGGGLIAHLSPLTRIRVRTL